jgi:hypothetical protein
MSLVILNNHLTLQVVVLGVLKHSYMNAWENMNGPSSSLQWMIFPFNFQVQLALEIFFPILRYFSLTGNTVNNLFFQKENNNYLLLV